MHGWLISRLQDYKDKRKWLVPFYEDPKIEREIQQ